MNDARRLPSFSRTGVQSFPTNTADLHRIRNLIRSEAERASLPASLVDDLVIAVSEACTNAAIHSKSPEMKVRWEISGNRIEVDVEDAGVFDKRIPVGFVDQEGGRGIPVMMALMDELSIKEGRPDAPGTLVRLIKHAA